MICLVLRISQSDEEDRQEHLVTCSSLNISKVSMSEYNCLFGDNEDEMAAVVKKLELLLKQRTEVLKTKTSPSAEIPVEPKCK